MAKQKRYRKDDKVIWATAESECLCNRKHHVLLSADGHRTYQGPCDCHFLTAPNEK